MKKQIFTEKTKALAAASLAQKIGYLKLQLPSSPDLPTETFNAHKIIRPKDQLFIVRQGTVEIWNTHQDILVTELEQDSIFGDMPLLGQTMLGTQAIAGSGGADLSVMDAEQITELIDPFSLLQEIGPATGALSQLPKTEDQP